MISSRCVPRSPSLDPHTHPPFNTTHPSIHPPTHRAQDKLASELRGDDVLFISDIRTGDPKCMSEEEVEECVQSDNENQANWHRLINAEFSMLKFRCDRARVP